MRSVLQSQKAASACLKSKQILPVGFARQHREAGDAEQGCGLAVRGVSHHKHHHHRWRIPMFHGCHGHMPEQSQITSYYYVFILDYTYMPYISGCVCFVASWKMSGSFFSLSLDASHTVSRYSSIYPLCGAYIISEIHNTDYVFLIICNCCVDSV